MNFDQLPDEAYLHLGAVSELAGGRSCATLKRWSNKGQFPAIVVIKNSSLCQVGDLRTWLRNPRGYARKPQMELTP